MRVFITGIGGMLGSAISSYHKSLGDEVRGCDIDPNPFLKGTDRIDSIDVRDFPNMSYAICDQRPQRVYHCAAMLGVQNTEEHPGLCRDINEDGTIAAFHAARTAKVKEFVFLSSSEVYGDPKSVQRIREDDELRGNNVYADSKIFGERYILDHTQDTMDVYVARMFNCYGLFQTKQFVIPKWIDAACTGELLSVYGSVYNRRSYLYSEDAAKALKAFADRADNKTIVNVGSETAYRLGIVAAMALEASGAGSNERRIMRLAGAYPDREVERDIPNRLPDTARLAQYYSVPMTPLSEGIKIVTDNRHTLRADWSYPRTGVKFNG